MRKIIRYVLLMIVLYSTLARWYEENIFAYIMVIPFHILGEILAIVFWCWLIFWFTEDKEVKKSKKSSDTINIPKFWSKWAAPRAAHK
jgi:predicted membrane protein